MSKFQFFGSKKKALFISIFLLLITTSIFAGWQLLTNPDFDLRSRANSNTTTYDVVVVGAGGGGIASAIEAARSGTKVLLIEETDMIGGQLITVPTMDLTNRGNHFGGIYHEFIKKVEAHYKQRNISITTCYWFNTAPCYEPYIGRKILMEMIKEQPNITLKTVTSVKKVNVVNSRVTSVLLSDNRTYTTKVLIDATEYGDIVRLAGDNYRIGNVTNTTLSKANENTCIQDITYTAVVKQYPSGVPSQLKITAPPPKYNEYKAEFAKVVTRTGNSNEPFKSPIKYPVDPIFHNRYRGLPHYEPGLTYNSTDGSKITKTTLNWANDYPGTGLSYRYLSDLKYRKEVNCEAKLKTINFIYYMQTELGMTNWSIANDEGFDTPYNRSIACGNIPTSLKTIEYNMPQVPYVRESIRGIGTKTFTAKDIDNTRVKSPGSDSSSIGLGDYHVDLHKCKDASSLELSFEGTSDIKASNSRPFQIPIYTLYSNKIPNLLYSEKNISQTRLANGATRMQPSTMVIGQASGALASKMVKGNKLSAKQINVLEVQEQLIDRNAILVYFKDIPRDTQQYKNGQKAFVNNILSGYGDFTFRPSNSFNRKQAATIIAKVFNISAQGKTGQIFTDAPRTISSNEPIYALYYNNITSGCLTKPLKFCPDNPITAEQMSIFVYRVTYLTNRPVINTYLTNGAIKNLREESKSYAVDKSLFPSCSGSWEACRNKPLLRSDILHMTNEILKIK